MTTFPGSPKLPKGTLIAVDTVSNLVVKTISFQYNPESLTRTLQAQVAGGNDTAREEALRLEGAPIETFKLDIEFDATDKLEKADATTVLFGVYPELAALETLIYPGVTTVVSNMALADIGMLEVVPMQAPHDPAGMGRKSGAAGPDNGL